ncbi:hypothetical protein DAMDJJ_25405 [Cupriavidus necator]
MRVPFLFRSVVAAIAVASLGACAGIPSAGPRANQVDSAQADLKARGIDLVDLSVPVIRRLAAQEGTSTFAETLGDRMPAQQDLAAGDLLDITIWEAPPAALFGGLQAESLSGAAGGHATQLPTQVIDAQGNIMVPFVGRVRAAGRSVAQVAAEISQGLNGRANRPQVLVRLAQNQTSFVTVISDAGGATRVPFTPKSERLLDAISSAGGGKQQLDKLTVQITRGNLVRSMPLSTVIKDPRQNIRLFPGDTVALLFKPNTFGSSPICVTV